LIVATIGAFLILASFTKNLVITGLPCPRMRYCACCFISSLYIPAISRYDYYLMNMVQVEEVADALKYQ
jgi:hypothetical protein